MTDGGYLHSGAGAIVKTENIGDGCTRRAPRINVGGSLKCQHTWLLEKEGGV